MGSETGILGNRFWASGTKEGIKLEIEITAANNLKDQGPRDPYLAFNDFRTMKCDFGSEICFY